MKKALLTLAALAMASSAFAQGTIFFFNAGLTDAAGNTYDAPINRPDGTGAGAGYTAGLFLASDLNTPLATTTFFGATGFFNDAADVAVPGVPRGGTANLVVRAWETAAGSFAASGIRGEQAFTSRPLGGANPPNPPDPAPDMGGANGFTGFTMIIPEPSTYALGMLGLGALAMMRRRK